MSDFLTNEEGRAEGIGAPAGAWEKTVEFDFDKAEDAALVVSETPSKHDPDALDAHTSAGHELIPVDGKKPARNGWRRMPAMTQREAVARFTSGRNVGVRLRATDLVIDVDPRHFAEGDDPFARLKADFRLPDAPFVRTGGGGWHHYYCKPVDLALVDGLDGCAGLEFKSLCRQVVAAGSVHPETGKPYRLDDDPLAQSLSEAPEATTALLDALRKAPRSRATDFAEIAPELLADWLALIDVELYRDELLWRKLMMSCHAATGGSGVEEFVTWSTADAVYSDHGEKIRSRWNSLETKPGAITVRTLIAALPKDKRQEATEALRRVSPEDDFPAGDVEVPASATDLKLAVMNRDHFTVLHGGKYLVGRERHHPTLGHVEVEWFPDHAICSHLDSRMVQAEDGKQKPLGSWWVKHPRRRSYEGVVFDPAPDRQHAKLYNLWRGWAVEQKAGNWSLMQMLVREVLCRGDEEAYDYVIRWAAFMVQQPHVPAEVALVFRGRKGVGKGTFGRALKLLAGMHGKQVAQAEHFVGRFNEHLMDCILLFVDEGYWAGEKKAEGALKNLITEPVLSFEPKGRPIVSGPNMLHVVIASNEDWIVPASADERRFAVFEAELSERGKASWVIGVLTASAVLSEDDLQELLRISLATILSGMEDNHSQKNLIAGALRAIADDCKREVVLKAVTTGLSEEDTVRLLVLAPYRKSTWELVDTLGETSQAKYWSEVVPDWIHDSNTENSESVNRLLKAGRPRAAFACIRFEPSKLDISVLFRLLSEMAQGGNDQPGHYQLEHYNVEEAFKNLNGSSVLTLDQKAGLEFAYIEVLARPWERRESYGIPNLERYVEAHPELFVQAVAWTYKRKDGATDPAEFQVPSDRVESMAKRGYKLLDALQRIPGHNDLGELEATRLAKWIATVRKSCAELSRTEIADICIGKLLSCAPVGKDGVWPCEPVRDVLEEIQSESIMQGAHTGIYNSRGVHWRGQGGGQERELADKYRKWGQVLQVSHPFVASKLLMGLARTYEHEASREDTEAGIRRRLR